MDSLTVQSERALAYITEKGWIATEHGFEDDAVSRAEFKKRPGLIALLNAAKRREFDAVVMRDETRLGGDMHRTGLVLQDLIEAGVRVFYYYTDEEVSLSGAVDKMLVAVRSFASELEREKIAGRTREHLQGKARRGLNTGGRCYGYDNVPVFEGDRRLHVDYAICPDEAAVVLEIFEAYARGDGPKKIAKGLNSRGVRKPPQGERGTGSWAPSAIWSMVRNERYRGVQVWGRISKGYKGGTRVRRKSEQETWLRTERPDLRVVPDELWNAVQARIARSKRGAGPKGGRPHKYMLSGIARCSQCGGPLTVANGKQGKERLKVYCCSYHRERGNSICPNTAVRPVDSLDGALVDWLQAHVLSEELITQTLRLVRQRLQDRSKATTADLSTLEGEARGLRVEIDRLVTAVACTDKAPEPLVAAISDRQERLGALEARLRAAKAAPEAISLELRRLEVEAKRRLTELRGALKRNPEQARAVLQTIFEGPIVARPVETPDGRRYQLEGDASVGKMLTSEISNSATPPGLAPLVNLTNSEELGVVHVCLVA